MRDINFFIKKLQDFNYRGEWKETYSHFYEKIYEMIDDSTFTRRSYYIDQLESYNGVLMDLPTRLSDNEEKLEFRRAQKHIIDLLYLIKEETKVIYISYGSDTTMKDKVCTFLGKLKVDFSVIDEESKPYSVDTFIKTARECDYAICLFTADDQIINSDKLRTSQNVIFELGFFLSQTGAKNIISFYPEDKFIETPLLLNDVHYEAFHSDGSWRHSLLNHMKKSGIYVDQNVMERVLSKTDKL